MSPADPKDGTLVVAVCHSPDHDTGPHPHGNLGWFAPAVSASLEPRTDPLLRREEFADVLAMAEARLIIGALSSGFGWGVDLAERRLIEVMLAAREQAATEARRELLAKVEGEVEALHPDDWLRVAGIEYVAVSAVMGVFEDERRLIEESDRG